LAPESLEEDGIMSMLIVVAKGCKMSFNDFKDAVFGYIMQYSIMYILVHTSFPLLVCRKNADFCDKTVHLAILALLQSVSDALISKRLSYVSIAAAPKNLRFKVNAKDEAQAGVALAVVKAQTQSVNASLHT